MPSKSREDSYSIGITASSAKPAFGLHGLQKARKTTYVKPNGAIIMYHKGIPVIDHKSVLQVPGNSKGVVYQKIGVLPDLAEYFKTHGISAAAPKRRLLLGKAGTSTQPKAISKSSNKTATVSISVKPKQKQPVSLGKQRNVSSTSRTAHHIFQSVVTDMVNDFKSNGQVLKVNRQSLWDLCKSSIPANKIDVKANGDVYVGNVIRKYIDEVMPKQGGSRKRLH